MFCFDTVRSFSKLNCTPAFTTRKPEVDCASARKLVEHARHVVQIVEIARHRTH
jgi:hypothetical protein